LSFTIGLVFILFDMYKFLAFSSFLTAVLAATRTTAPSGAITVGTTGTFKTIQSAVNSLSTTSTTAQSIFIQPGTYSEQVFIAARAAPLTVYGYTEDTTSYTSNVVTITHSLSLGESTSDDATGTVRNWAANSKFYNINIKNTFGESSSNGQAIALSAEATNQGYYGVGLYGYQDTLLSETGFQVYGKCYIEGAVDFIFGQSAMAWIDSSDIRVSAGGGAITASGRITSSSASYYVINKSSVGAATESTASSFSPPGAGTVFLGRPWSEFARVAFQNTVLSDIINSAGWEIWSTATPNTEDVTFVEFGNTGAGASGTRVSFSSKLSSAVTIASILGSNYATWVDTTYLA